jgi:tripartite-type tricarboxylate transporter receptor subunit TctC
MGCRPSGDAGTGDYPRQPIRLVVPFSVGGGTDMFARVIKKAVDDQELLPEPLVIVNVEGAGATIGSRRVKDAAPDGYTLLVLHEAMMTAKYSGKVDYGPEAFDAVAGTGEMGMVIAVAESSPFQSLRELIEAASREPNQLTFGANLGALTHFAGLQLEQLAPGARFRFAQIGGGAERFADLKGGHIDVTGFSLEEFVRFRSEGLRGLAFLGPERHPAVPEMPTAREQGFDLEFGSMFFWWVPKQTPREVREKLADVLQAAMQTKYVRQKMADIHCEPVCLRGAALRRRIASSTQNIARLASRHEANTREGVQMPRTPEWILLSLGVLAVPVAVGSWRQWHRRHAERQAAVAAGAPRARLDLAGVTIVLACAYATVLSLGGDYRLTTLLFVYGLGATLARSRRIGVHLWILTAALLLSVGMHALFTGLLTVDLP